VLEREPRRVKVLLLGVLAKVFEPSAEGVKVKLGPIEQAGPPGSPRKKR
jgi:hypothetical protein